VPKVAKSKIFVGSSVKGLPIAYAIQKSLEHDAECTVWSQGIFQPGSTPIEALTKTLDEHDFAIFVFFPEDIALIKDEHSTVVRDNVLFELGLFVGKLGRQRNFFVVPQGEKLHLATDLAGIVPSTYNPAAAHLESAVASACYYIRQRIQELGNVSLYDSSKDFKPFHFLGVRAQLWKDKKPISPRGEGSLSFEQGGVLRLERSNTDGRFEIQLRRYGPKEPSFRRSQDLILRVLRVVCEAKVDHGRHMLRFVLKDEKTDTWVANETKSIDSTNWSPLECYFQVPTTVDLLFRIDDEEVSPVPSSVFLRNLLITEET